MLYTFSPGGPGGPGGPCMEYHIFIELKDRTTEITKYQINNTVKRQIEVIKQCCGKNLPDTRHFPKRLEKVECLHCLVSHICTWHMRFYLSELKYILSGSKDEKQ